MRNKLQGWSNLSWGCDFWEVQELEEDYDALLKESAKDQKNASMSQAESVMHLDRIKELEKKYAQKEIMFNAQSSRILFKDGQIRALLGKLKKATTLLTAHVNTPCIHCTEKPFNVETCKGCAMYDYVTFMGLTDKNCSNCKTDDGQDCRTCTRNDDPDKGKIKDNWKK